LYDKEAVDRVDGNLIAAFYSISHTKNIAIAIAMVKKTTL